MIFRRTPTKATIDYIKLAVVNHIEATKNSVLPSRFLRTIWFRKKFRIWSSRSLRFHADILTRASSVKFRRIFSCRRLLRSAKEKRLHHCVSLSSAKTWLSTRGEEEKKGMKGGDPKRDLSSRLTNDRTSNGAARSGTARAYSRHVEAETEKGEILLSSFRPIVLLKKRRRQRW